jgi:hypothetical protein
VTEISPLCLRFEFLRMTRPLYTGAIILKERIRKPKEVAQILKINKSENLDVSNFASSGSGKKSILENWIFFRLNIFSTSGSREDKSVNNVFYFSFFFNLENRIFKFWLMLQHYLLKSYSNFFLPQKL